MPAVAERSRRRGIARRGDRSHRVRRRAGELHEPAHRRRDREGHRDADSASRCSRCRRWRSCSAARICRAGRYLVGDRCAARRALRRLCTRSTPSGAIAELEPARLIAGRRRRSDWPREYDARIVSPSPIDGGSRRDCRARAAVARLETCSRRAGPVDLDAWEPAYGRLAEAQVKWESAHGRPLPAR